MQDLFSPVLLLFLVIFVGTLVGKIKLKRISLNMSAVLIVAVLVGYLAITYDLVVIDDVFQNQMNFLSSVGTSMFVAVIGLLAGQGMVGKGAKRKNTICFMLGMLTVGVGFACMSLIFVLDTSLDASMMYGVFCGAMTSTPGLAAVCEMTGVSADLATIGYSCAYLLGVIGVVIFVQWRGKNVEVAGDALPDDEVPVTTYSKAKDELIYICLTAVCGMLLGKLVIPGVNISLGNSGGILCSGIIVGLCLAKRKVLLDQSVLSIYRNLGLVMFFVGTGVPAGAKLISLPDLKYVLYGAIITTIPIVLLYTLCRWVLKLSILDAVCIIAGGMTSTPAIGILLKESKRRMNLSAYSMTYVGALLMMVLLFKIIEMVW